MGRKVHPLGFRLKVTKTWDARWFAEGEKFVEHLQEDLAIRKLIHDEAENAGVSKIEIERFPGKVKVIIHTSKPGVLIGRKGANVKIMRKSLEELVGKTIDVDIKEIETPDLDAYLVADNIARQIEGRISYSRAMNRTIQRTMREGAEGIRVEVSGRLGGAFFHYEPAGGQQNRGNGGEMPSISRPARSEGRGTDQLRPYCLYP